MREFMGQILRFAISVFSNEMMCCRWHGIQLHSVQSSCVCFAQVMQDKYDQIIDTRGRGKTIFFCLLETTFAFNFWQPVCTRSKNTSKSEPHPNRILATPKQWRKLREKRFLLLLSSPFLRGNTTTWWEFDPEKKFSPPPPSPNASQTPSRPLGRSPLSWEDPPPSCDFR